LLRGIPTGPQATQQQIDLADHRRHRVAQLVSGNGDEGVAGGNRRPQFGIALLQLLQRRWLARVR